MDKNWPGKYKFSEKQKRTIMDNDPLFTADVLSRVNLFANDADLDDLI